MDVWCPGQSFTAWFHGLHIGKASPFRLCLPVQRFWHNAAKKTGQIAYPVLCTEAASWGSWSLMFLCLLGPRQFLPRHCLECLLNSVQQVMLKCFVQQGIAQDSKSSELDRRFEILKDACEMNSNLVGEVQRLKACLGQWSQIFKCVINLAALVVGKARQSGPKYATEETHGRG